jgi:hypothetical protein
VIGLGPAAPNAVAMKGEHPASASVEAADRRVTRQVVSTIPNLTLRWGAEVESVKTVERVTDEVVCPAPARS